LTRLAAGISYLNHAGAMISVLVKIDNHRSPTPSRRCLSTGYRYRGKENAI
jgi:hypothetical protein